MGPEGNTLREDSQQNIADKDISERNLSLFSALGVESGLDEGAATDVFSTFLECFINVRLEEGERALGPLPKALNLLR